MSKQIERLGMRNKSLANRALVVMGVLVNALLVFFLPQINVVLAQSGYSYSGYGYFGYGYQAIGNIFINPGLLTVGSTGTLSAVSTSGLTVSFASGSPTVCSVTGNIVRGLKVGTCSLTATQPGNAVYSAANPVTLLTAVTVATPPVTLTPELRFLPGWNLVGNSVHTSFNVANILSDASRVSTVWKWLPASGKWAFYTPTLTDGGAAYAATKGYDALTTIEPGDGFWVNAKIPFSTLLPAGAILTSSEFQDQIVSTNNRLRQGWNLIATGDGVTPSEYNRNLSSTPPVPNITPVNVTTLWAWDSSAAAWYFYAPSLDASGNLLKYTTDKGYLDFMQHNKVLDTGTGFWVNKP